MGALYKKPCQIRINVQYQNGPDEILKGSLMYPLEGLKVIEIARVLAGPWIGQTLADLGADVIKVESPEGYDTRNWGPNFVSKGSDRSAAYFHSTNRGKQGITIDFKDPERLAYLKELISTSDVLIENFKVGRNPCLIL